MKVIKTNSTYFVSWGWEGNIGYSGSGYGRKLFNECNPITEHTIKKWEKEIEETQKFSNTKRVKILNIVRL